MTFGLTQMFDDLMDQIRLEEQAAIDEEFDELQMAHDKWMERGDVFDEL